MDEEIVRQAQKRATSHSSEAGNESTPPFPENPPDDLHGSVVKLLHGKEIRPVPIRWLWSGWLAAGSVAIWSGEDDARDTLVPRLIASGADMGRIFFVDSVLDGRERRAFDPARDMEPLRRKLLEVGDVRLLIVDPVVSAIAGDSHKNAEVRRGLQPLLHPNCAGFDLDFSVAGQTLCDFDGEQAERCFVQNVIHEVFHCFSC